MRHYAILGDSGRDRDPVRSVAARQRRPQNQRIHLDLLTMAAGPPAVWSEEEKTESHGVAFVSVHAASSFFDISERFFYLHLSYSLILHMY
jgi:hypothetical protein